MRLMAFQRQDRLAGLGADQLQKASRSRKGESFAIWADGDRVDGRGSFVCEKLLLACGQIPDNDAAVVPARDHSIPIGMERDAIDRARMSLEVLRGFVSRQVPDFHFANLAQSTSPSEAVAVRTEG